MTRRDRITVNDQPYLVVVHDDGNRIVFRKIRGKWSSYTPHDIALPVLVAHDEMNKWAGCPPTCDPLHTGDETCQR